MQSIREFISTIVILLTSISNSGVTFTRNTSSSAIDVEIENPGTGIWEILEVRIHIDSDVGGSGDLIVDIDSGVDEIYDVNLITHDMTETQDFRDNEIDTVLESSDKVRISWPNASGKTYGLVVVTKGVN